MQFRNDINGLRAIAVLPVLFFHAQWSLFPGGFLGVDVFFVISGFLITSLIIKDLNAGSFSLLSFYNRRARRILPALFFTCIVTSFLAFFFMLPYDLKNFGQSLVATVLSANNILLYLTSGYWSLASEFKPLYHTWSLGVEEQYYVFAPLFLLLIYKVFNKATLKAVLFLLAVLFFISFSLSLMSNNKELNFLIISHRMWELLAGSACALIIMQRKKPNNVIACVGFFLILVSYVFPYLLSKNQAVYTLIPVIGTMLIILFSANQTSLGKALSIKPIALIGTISYSIYLFHMPLIAFLRLATEGPASPFKQLIIVFLSLPLAYLSWRYVEQKFKSSIFINHRLFYALHISIALILISFGYALHKTYGLEKLDPKFKNTVSQQHYTDAPNKLIKTSFSGGNKLLIIGDSFARDVVNMLSENQVTNNYEIIYQPSLNVALDKQLLSQANITLIAFSKGLTNPVNPNTLRTSSTALFNFIKTSGSNAYLIGTKNFGYNNNFIRIKSFFASEEVIQQHKVSPSKDLLLTNEIEKNIWQDRFIDVFSSILDAQGKVPMFTQEGRLISYDTNHLTPEGSKYLGNILLNDTKLGSILNASK